MYLSIENFTCLKEQISLYRTVLKLFILSKTVWNQIYIKGAQWLNGRALDSRPKGSGFEPHRRHCVVSLSKNINPSLVLVQPRKIRPFITERLLMGRKESNQTNKRYISTLANSMDPDQLASLVNSVDPDQLASEVACWSGSTLFSMQDVSL